MKLTKICFRKKNTLLIKRVLIEIKQLKIIKTQTFHFTQEIDKLLSTLRKQRSDNLGHNLKSS